MSMGTSHLALGESSHLYSKYAFVCYTAPQILSPERYGMTYGDHYPALQRYADALRARPSIAGSFPPHWANTPGKDWLASV